MVVVVNLARVHGDNRGQATEVCSLLPHCGSCHLNSIHWACPEVPCDLLSQLTGLNGIFKEKKKMSLFSARDGAQDFMRARWMFYHLASP